MELATLGPYSFPQNGGFRMGIHMKKEADRVFRGYVGASRGMLTTDVRGGLLEMPNPLLKAGDGVHIHEPFQRRAAPLKYSRVLLVHMTEGDFDPDLDPGALVLCGSSRDGKPPKVESVYPSMHAAWHFTNGGGVENPDEYPPAPIGFDPPNDLPILLRLTHEMPLLRVSYPGRDNTWALQWTPTSLRAIPWDDFIKDFIATVR